MDGEDAGQVDAERGAPAEKVENEMFIEVKCIQGLPPQMATFNITGDVPKTADFPEHAFLYELDVFLTQPNVETQQAADYEAAAPPSVFKHTFTLGRLRRLDEKVEALMEQGVLPQSALAAPQDALSEIGGPSDVSTAVDRGGKPAAAISPTARKTAGVSSSGTSSGSSEAPGGTTEEGSTVVSGTGTANESGVTSAKKSARRPSAPAAVSPGAPAVQPQPSEDQMSAAPLAILWLWSKPPEVPEVDEKAAGKGGKKPEGQVRKRDGEDLPTALQQPPHHMTTVPLNATQLQLLQESIAGGAGLSVQLRRVFGPKARPEWEDVNEGRWRGSAVLPLTPFGEPGTESFSYVSAVAPAPPPPPDVDGKGGKKAPKKAAGKGAAPAFVSQPEADAEIHPYEEAQTALSVCVTFAKAPVALPTQRPRPGLFPSDVAPFRPAPAQRPVNAKRRYRSEVRTIAKTLIGEFREHCAANSQPAAAASDTKRAFMQYISSSGRGYAYRERLKYCVLGLVREQYGKREAPDGGPAPPPDKLQMEAFYNELYSQLIDEMRLCVDAAFGHDKKRSVAATGDKWLRVALEAETVQDFAVASKAHTERLAVGPSKPESEDEELPVMWADYAEFFLRVRDGAKAEQAYREALAINITHARSLQGYGLLLLSRGRGKEAEVPIQSALEVHPNDRLCWGLLVLWHHFMSVSEAERAASREKHRRYERYARVQASRVAAGQEAELHPPSADPPADVAELPLPSGVEPLDLMLARFCISLWLEDLGLECLNMAEAAGADSCGAVGLLRGKAYSQMRSFEDARKQLEQLLQSQDSGTVVEAQLLLGDVYAAMDNSTAIETSDGATTPHKAAAEMYSCALKLRPHGAEGAVYVRLGNILLNLGQFGAAKDAFIAGVQVWPCGLTWLGVGVACLRRGEAANAERALNESVVLNSLYAPAWAYLCLLCLQSPIRQAEADHALQQARVLGLSDGVLEAEIGAALLTQQRFAEAEHTLRRAIADKDLGSTRLRLAECLMNAGRLEEAAKEMAVAEASGLTDDENAELSALRGQLREAERTGA